MPEFQTETLFRVNLSTKRTGYTMFLLVWAVDAMEAMAKVSGICGADGEYSCDGISIQMENGEPQRREKPITYSTYSMMGGR